MTSTHFLSTALLICSISAFAQQQNTAPSNSTTNRDQEKSALNLSGDSVKKFAAGDRLLSVLPPIDSMSFPSPRQRIDETVYCYTIRSYVFARDRKDSDSVHLVGYSTCPPANRLRLRTTEAGTPSLTH